MGIIAKNILVGGVKLPTEPEKEIVLKKLVDKQPKKETQQYVQRQTKSETASEETSNYLKKADGELIRHINKKSSYLTDMLEIETE